MPMDGALLFCLGRQAGQIYRDQRVEKIYQEPGGDVVLRFSNPRKTPFLLLSAHPREGGIVPLPSVPENPPRPPLFAMVLRKHLGGARLRSIRQEGLDRILYLEFAARDETGDPTRRTLILEVMGKHSNLILVDGDGTVIDAVRKFNHLVSRHREILPGVAYRHPPSQDRIDLFSVEEEELSRDLTARLLEAPDTPAATLLSRSISGLSRRTCELLLDDAGFPPEEALLPELDTMRRLPQVLLAFRTALRDGTLSFCMEVRDGIPSDLLLFPPKADGTGIRAFSDPAEMLRVYRHERQVMDGFRREQASLRKLLQAAWKKAEKKREIHSANIRLAEETDHYRIQGELLLANLSRVRPGMSSVTVENYYDGTPVTIPLDPSLPPSRNATRLFRRAARVREAAKVSRRLLPGLQEETAYLESVLLAVESARAPEDLLEIRRELTGTGYLRRQKKSPPGTRSPEPPAPLRYHSTAALRIEVGRNNRQNDALTRDAGPEDIWLHARQIPGAHVILRTRNGEYDEASLREAAMLAAWHSKARDSANVPVDYTRIRYVKKPGGAKPGMVTYQNQRTIHVTPDGDSVEALEDRGHAGSVRSAP